MTLIDPARSGPESERAADSAATRAGRRVWVEPMTGAHGPEVIAIYQAGIDEGDATFEVAAPAWEKFSADRLPGHRFVAAGVAAGATAGAAGAAGAAELEAPSLGVAVLGWVAASAVSDRCVYSGVVEHSVYVRPDARSAGIGRMLLDSLIASTEADGIWTIQSGIFPENAASVALHLAAGFRIVGRRERIGQQCGRWRDVLMLERRSPRL